MHAYLAGSPPEILGSGRVAYFAGALTTSPV